MGGGVGGLLYAENADSSGLNYKHYNLRGDIVATTDSGGSVFHSMGTRRQTSFFYNSIYMGNEFIILIFYM